jgi:hydrogenase maturation factor
VVEDALTAASTGLRENGVTSMHDVTEGGLLGALYELSEASGNGLEIDSTEVIVSEEAKRVCDLFEIDPYATLSEGTLIISVKPEKAQRVLQALKSKGIRSAVIGKVTDAQEGRWIKRKGARKALKKPSGDPYWEAYWKAQQKGWK